MNTHSSFNTSLTDSQLNAACDALRARQNRQIERQMKMQRALVAIMRQWWKRARQRAALRRQLMEMDVALIEKDIGVPAGTLGEEAYKPFWKH
ncbi:hypothetical protein [Marinobacter sediminum]|uniref:hypothetical protein n=1 Tax=Marinobacter sediminum TaxID=256323 RepID=UPI0019398A87|nr:hypothetical protein [Marinobacter sediminum]